jgi:hypothetical protein
VIRLMMSSVTGTRSTCGEDVNAKKDNETRGKRLRSSRSS